MAQEYRSEAIKFDEKNAIRLIAGEISDDKTGLPEWLKNSSDEYRRRGAPKEQRVIGMVYDRGTKNRPHGMGVLDFG